jgi:hypothetical protein
MLLRIGHKRGGFTELNWANISVDFESEGARRSTRRSIPAKEAFYDRPVN